MREVIERIKSKYGMSATLTLYMDGSGHIQIGVFSNHSDTDYEYVRFNTIEELETLLKRRKNMKGKILQDLAYCEIFAEYDKPPEDIALHAGDMIEIINTHDGTHLTLLQDEEGALVYATIQIECVELIEEE